MGSEIQRKDIISDEALQAPLQLGKNIDVATMAIDRLIAKSKESGVAISGASSTSKLTKETQTLTQAQIELDKIQKQLTVSVAKNNEDYIASKRVLNDLNQVINQKTILGNKDAKAIEAQTASIRQLETALQKNRKAYADLKGDQERNGKAGTDLKKVILEQAKSVDQLRSAMGQHKAEVSDYREGLEGLVVTQEAMGLETGNLISSVRNLGKAFFSLLSNPIFLAFAALAALFGALKSSVETFFETTEEGEKVAERQQAVWDTFFFTLRKGWATIGKEVADIFGLDGQLKTVLTGFISYFSPALAAIFVASANEAEKMADIAHAANERIVKDIIVKAQSELDADKLILESKDKLNYSDEQRLQFLKEAFKIRLSQSEKEKSIAEDQLTVVINRLAIEKSATAEKVALAFKSGEVEKEMSAREIADLEKANEAQKYVQLTTEDKRKIAEATAKILNTQNDFYAEQKRVVSQIATLELDIFKTREASARAQEDARLSLNKSELNAQLKIDEEKIKNSKSTQEEITNEIYQVHFIRQSILEEAERHELLVVKRAAEDRVVAKGILNKKEIALEISKDETLIKENKRITTEFESAILESDNKLKIELNQNVFNRLKKDFDNLTSSIKTDTNKQLISLDEAYGNGQIKNITAYETERKKIVEEGNRNVLIEQSNFIREQISKLELSNEQKIALTEAFSKSEMDIYALDANRKIALDKQVYDAEVQLQNKVFEASSTIIQNLSDAKVQAIDAELTALKEATNEKIKMLGTVDSADIEGTKILQAEKDHINSQAARKEKQLNDEKKHEQHKAAVYEKELAVTQTSINGIEAVSKAYAKGGIYLALLVAAAEALLLAEVVSKPIPAYEMGVDSVPQTGPAIVGEKGTELVVTPKGRLQFTPSSTSIMHLDKGSKVYTHEETLNILAMGALSQQPLNHSTFNLSSDREMLSKIDTLIAVTKQNKTTTDIASIGSKVYDIKKESETYTSITRSYALGKWFKG